MDTTNKLQRDDPYWLLDDCDRDEFKHYLSQFIAAHCPACGSRKVLVDGVEHKVTIDDRMRILAAYFAVCDDCSHVWCRASSPDVVASLCIAQTASEDAGQVDMHQWAAGGNVAGRQSVRKNSGRT
jgi:hypothetical protein